MYTLASVNFSEDWHYSLPTLETPVSLLRQARARTVDDFKIRFEAAYGNYLSALSYENVLIAGGATMNCLLGRAWTSDVDIFLYGLSREKANVKIKAILEAMYNSYADYFSITKDDITENEVKAHMLSAIETIRNDNCVTVRFDGGQEIQIILRLYESIGEILENFDIGSCSVGYDGDEIYFSKRGVRAYETFTNVIEPEKRSTTYEYRLLKYWNRGFKIVLPDLDVKKLSTSNFKYGISEVAALPYLPFSYSALKGNKIVVSNFLREFKCKSDYTDEELSPQKILYLNLRNLVLGKGGFYFYSTGPNYNVLYDTPYLDASWIEKFYDGLEMRIESKKVVLKSLLSYVYEDIARLVIQRTMEQDCPMVDDLLQDQKQRVFLAQSALKKSRLAWKTKNPGSQINGSYNPVLSDPRDWYGDYLLVE